MRYSKRAFTLVELLVVIAVSSILLVLIFGPMVQSFNLTNEARAESEAQDTARRVLEEISTELANASYVRDNTTPDAMIEISLPADYFPAGTPPAQQFVMLPYAKVDFFPVAQGDPGNPTWNPYAGKTDPTLRGRAPIGELGLPLARGVSMVRYFIGLRDPFAPYQNGSEQRLVQAGKADNLYCLYRSEVVPLLNNGQVNSVYFDLAPDGGPLLDDPDFFTYLPKDTQAKRDRIIAWQKASRIITQLEGTDLITVLRDKKHKTVVIDPATNRPQVMPLLSFQPTAVSDEPASPDSNNSLGQEMPNRIPTGFTTKNAGWTGSYSLKWYRKNPAAVGSDFYYIENDYSTGVLQKIVRHSYPVSGGNNGSEAVFNLTRYMSDLERGQPNLANAIFPGIKHGDPVAFVAEADRGKLVTSIPREHYMPPGSQLPAWTTGTNLTYALDPNPDKATINGAFNYQWQKYPLWSRRIERFLRLKADANSPLAAWPSTVSIVPNSEAVFGPDQRPGPHFGAPVRYRRAPSLDNDLGPNEYRINYSEMKYDPATLTSMGFNPNDPDVKQFILPRYEAGYIKFYSDPNYPLPAGQSNIIVTYHFQFNLPTDIITVDYATKEVMTVSLSIKRYMASSGNAHLTSLTNRVHVRNFLK